MQLAHPFTCTFTVVRGGSNDETMMSDEDREESFLPLQSPFFIADKAR